jgi:hypothetical protein
MAFLLSLERHIDWVRVFTLLGDSPNLSVLPYRTECMFCQGELTVMYDPYYHGQWFYCDGCERCGGLIELAAEIWQLSIEATIRKLIAYNALVLEENTDITKASEIHAEWLVKRPKIHKAFWEQSRQKLAMDDDKTMRMLQQKMRFRVGLDRERWLAGPGQFVGGGVRDDIEMCFQPGIQPENCKFSCKRIFKGGNWHEVLMIPSYDLPGRIKGYLFVGREGNVPADITFAAISRPALKGAGLFLWPAAKRRHEFEDTIVAIPDPLVAVRLHCNHFVDNSDTIPLVAYWDDKQYHTSAEIWGTLPPGPVVFWGPADKQVYTLRHARAADGFVTEVEYPKDWKAWSRRTPAEWLHRVRASAIHWETALEKALVELPVPKAEELLHGAGVTTEEFQRILATLPFEVVERYNRIPDRWRTIKDGSIELIETDKGWISAKTKQIISDAIIRIEHVVHHPQQNTIYYSGYVLFKGQKIPFYDEEHMVHKRTPFWLRNLIVKSGLGYPTIGSMFENRLITFATRLHPPQTATAFEHIGWDDSRGVGCFVFPGYVIKPGGIVEDESSSLKIVAKGFLPATGLQKPSGLTREHVHQLEENTPAIRLVWASVASILTSLISPILNEPSSGLVVIGPSSDMVATVCRLLGCTRQVVAPTGLVPNPHTWPTVLIMPNSKISTKPTIDWVFGASNPNGILTTNWYTAQVLRCRKYWHVLDTVDYVGNVQDLLTVLPTLIPNFLLYLAKKNFCVTPCISGFATVAEELRNWFAEEEGELLALDTGLAMMDPYAAVSEVERGVDAFFNIICSLYCEGSLSLEHTSEPEARVSKFTIVDTGENGLFISGVGINSLLNSRNIPLLDVPAVAKLLAAGGVLFKEGTYCSRPGWFIREDSWEERLKQWKTRQDRPFRVVG